ncbi:hypothetical protein [Bacillus sp. REN10]|uniref:hypothetical protein n=1 Tax=Bacillus sp. REN10 TaxID=2782541 RepID=UPI00193C1C83|nr:hypothetical protein [Bacillus sp. REN10]
MLVKKIGMIIATVFMLLFVSSPSFIHPAHADDYADEGHEEEENGVMKEGGELIGWAGMAGFGLAATLFPLRKLMKPVKKRWPNQATHMAKATRLSGKWHIWMGSLTLLAVCAHGAMMFLAERELELREYIGIGAAAFMAAAALIGYILSANKRSKAIRFTHMGILGIAAVMTLIHLLLS